MLNYKKIFRLKFILVVIFFPNIIFADNHNINEILELIQKDLKTLEKAVYSESTNSNSQKNTNENSEDVLTRHLLKLSDVEKQFQELTNKFEEINFKLDKLSNRLSKVQADNQIRFQEMENTLSSGEVSGSIFFSDSKFSVTIDEVVSTDCICWVVSPLSVSLYEIAPNS